MLDRLELVVVVDNESDTLSSVDPGVPQLPETASLLGRIPPSRHHDGHVGVSVFDHLCVACHGLSVLVTGRADDETRTMLFDVGPYGDTWLDNAERLGIDLTAIETVFLPHWHADHSGGLPTVVAAIADERRAVGLPAPTVDLHPDRPDQRGIRLPTGDFALLPPEPTFEELAADGGAVETHPDPLILDERFLATHVRGRGVTVLSACSHAGVVNACLGARSAYPDTVRDLHALDRPEGARPRPLHGLASQGALADAFAPGRFAPSVVGSRYVLAAQ